MSAAIAVAWHHHRLGRDLHRLRFFLVHGQVAAAAVVIGGAELHQQAVIATYDLACVYRGKGRGHRVVGVPERATPGTESGGEVPKPQA